MNKARKEKASRVFERVLKDIKPSKAEAQETIANVNSLTDRLRRIVPRSVEIMVVGSIARSTNLKGDADVDIFMLFDKSYKKDRLAAIGLEYGKRLVDKKKGERYEIKYAEHPYVRAYLGNGLRADLVPASKIEDTETLATAVDRTPLHTEFINSHLSDAQRDEVRLLKYLLKAHGIYGAEIKTGGFSGYLCELLIHHTGSLVNLLESAAVLKLPAVLDPKNKAFMNDEGITRKFGKRFVVIDPVDTERNVAAAVTEESLAKFVLVARDFVAEPRIGLFYGKGFSSVGAVGSMQRLVKGSGLDFFLLVAKVPDKSVDVVWPQLRKVSYMITDYMKAQGFDSYLDLCWIDGRRGMVLIASPRVEMGARLMKGPDVFKTTQTSAFIRKHSSAIGFVQKGSALCALERGRHSKASEIIKEIAKGRIVRRHKDISFKGAKVFVNRIPKEYMNGACAELIRALSI